jgi:nitrile hydratase
MTAPTGGGERTSVDGIHDLGGVEGYGSPDFAPNERARVDQRWEAVAGAGVFALLRSGLTNLDAFRHRIERIDPRRYFDVSYWGRWLAAVESTMVDQGLTTPDEIDDVIRRQGHEPAASAEPPLLHPAVSLESRDNAPGALRPTATEPRFAPGDEVRTLDHAPHAGHHRLPHYVRGRKGTVVRVYPGFTFPDTMAHGRGENPCHVYAVRFAATELWGPDADGAQRCHLDVFEPYLMPAQLAH